MTNPPDPNIQSGVPTAVSTVDNGAVGSAANRDAHYETDADQVVKVVHQVTPDSLPNQGPTDFAKHGGQQAYTAADVKITPTSTSVWEALPPDKGSSQ